MKSGIAHDDIINAMYCLWPMGDKFPSVDISIWVPGWQTYSTANYILIGMLA